MSGNIQMRNCVMTIKKQIEETGIIFNIVYNSDDDYTKALKNGSYTLALVDMNIGSWPELEVLFKTKASMNINGYSNIILDGLMNDMFENENIPARLAEIKTILDEDYRLLVYISHMKQLLCLKRY